MESFVFQPIIRFVKFPTRSIAFDTQLNTDGNRELFAKVVSIHTEDRVLESFVCTNNIEYEDDDVRKQRFVSAPIIYVQKFADNREETKELATIRLTFPGVKMKGKFHYPDIRDIETAINRKLADAFMVAIDIEIGASSFESIMPSNNVVRGNFHRQANPMVAEKRLSPVFKSAALVLFFPLLIAVIWGVGKLNSRTDQVYLSRFANNPQAIASQVETTKTVLKNMGLDPGKSGDIGCLAKKP